MKTLILTAIRCSLMFVIQTATYATSAQWDLDPISGDWNTADNWTPNAVPNGPADTANFGLSKTTDVSISADTEVNGITFTAAATNPYTITASPGLTLTISGVGVTNNSGITQNFATAIDAFGNSGTIVFSKSATAGPNVAYANNANDFGYGQMIFKNNSTAGSANIDNFGSINFLNRSTAGSADIFNEHGVTVFSDSSTAGNASIIAGFVSNLVFFGHSTAGSAFISVEDNALLQFVDSSTAGSATIFSRGPIFFNEFSSAGNANIAVFTVSPGFIGEIVLAGSSTGGTAQIQLLSNFSLEPLGGILDISGHNAPGVTIGSLEGDEPSVVFLGANNLTVGSNNLSTTFSGVIQDGGGEIGVGGSLTKIGTGTLELTGANTYTGDTNINRGVLQVDGSITSNTFVNHGGTLAGTGAIDGNVTNNGRVSPGALDVPGVLTVVHNYTQAQFATLMIQIAGMNTGQFSVLNDIGNASLNGFLDPVLLNGFVPTIGDSFTFLNYASLTGEFSHIQHQVFDNGMLQWSVIYEANHAILTVEQHVPDQGSTFLLLTLGLLGLVTYHRRLLPKQS